MTGFKVKAVVEVLRNKPPQSVYLITMSFGSYQVKCISEAGKIRGVSGSDFPGHQSVSSCSDESWIVVPESFCPSGLSESEGLEVSMKVAGETVGDPSGLSVCIDIEHPWKDYFPIIGQALEYLFSDRLRRDKTVEPYRHEWACFPETESVLMEQRRALLMKAHQEKKRRALLLKTDLEEYFNLQIESEQSVSDDFVPYGVTGGHQSLWWKAVKLSFSHLTGEERVDWQQLMKDNLSFLTRALASEDPASIHLGIRLSPVVNSDTAPEARMGALELLDNSLRASFWKMFLEEEELRGKEILFGSRGTNGYRLAVKKLEEKELRGTNGYLFPDVVTEDPASLQPGLRDLSPVVNADTATEARMGALGLLDNTHRMSRIANAWKMCFPRLSEVSEEAHDWIKEVVGMGVMGMSASAGYGTQCVVAKAACTLAFASCATAFWLPRNWMTTIRFLNKVGAVACIAGILAAIGHDLPQGYKWWVAVAAFLPPAAAVVVA